MKYYPIIFAYLTLMCFGFIDNGRGPAYPLFLDEFKVSAASGSLIFTLSSIFGLLANFFSKHWLTKFTPKHALQGSLIFQALGTILFAVPIHFDLSFNFVLLGSILFGIGAGSSNVCNNIIIARSTLPNVRRKFFSGLHSVYAIASLVSPIFFSYSYKLTKFWPMYFYFLSTLPLLIAFALTFVKFNIHGESELKKIAKVNVPLFLRARIGFMLALNVTAEVLISSRLALYTQKYLGKSQYEASMALSLFFLSLLIGRFIPAIIHLPGKPLYLLLTSSVISFIMVSLGLYYNPIFLSLAGFTMSIFFPTAMDWITHRFREKSDYMMASSLNYVGTILILMHICFGNIVKFKGIQVAMHLSPLVLLISIFFTLSFIKERDTNN